MRSHRQPQIGLLLALGFLAMLAVPLARAEPLKKEEKPADPPLFLPVEIKPIHVAALVFTAPLTPRIGPWSAAADVYAGAHAEARVWSLRGAFSTKPGRTLAGAASLFLGGFGPQRGVSELALLQAGDERDCWTLLNTDEVRPFPEFYRRPGIIRDRKAISNGDNEIDAYCQILTMAHFTSAKAFAKAARRDLTYAHLFNEPEQHRGEVVHVSGRLVRLRRFDPPPDARGAGVSDLYEGWIMTDRYGENPACVVFTDLPAGLKVGEEGPLSIEGVGFNGYFYKRYRYKAYDSKKHNEFRDAPLLIGHTLSGSFGANAVEEAPDNWGQKLIWAFLGVIGTAFAGVIGLTCWFRYHDRRTRQRLTASREVEFVPPEPLEEISDEPAPFANDNGSSAEGVTKELAPRPRFREFPPAPE